MPVAGDFNGDGIVDLGTCKDGQWKVALGTGSGFGAAAQFDLLMSEGAPVLAPHDVRWTVRGWLRDCMHETRGCMYPGGVTPTCGESPGWTTSILGGSAAVGGVNFTVGTDGSIYVSHRRTVTGGRKCAVYVKNGAHDQHGRVRLLGYRMPLRPAPGRRLFAVLGGQHFAGGGLEQDSFHGLPRDTRGCRGIDRQPVSQVDIVSPTIINANVSTAQYITGDFNGDGLTDVAVVKDQQVYPALSTGGQLVRTGPWAIPFGDKDYTTADYNGDGLTDIAWYDRSTGKVKVVYSTGSGLGSTAELPLTFSLRLAHDQIQVGEWNGDGLPDLCIIDNISGDIEMAYSSGTAADLLKKVDNGLGGVGELTYQPSTRMVNDYLPMVMSVVTETRASNGLGETNSTKYIYSKGLYDSATKEFRGFGHVEVRDFEQTSVVTDFHQDYQRKGRAYRTRGIRCGGQSVEQGGADVFGERAVSGPQRLLHAPGSGGRVHLRRRPDVHADPRPSHLRRLRKSEGVLHGRGCGVTGDEKSTVTTYNLNPTSWIVNTASLIQSYDASGTLVSQVRTYYDGATDIATAAGQREHHARGEMAQPAVGAMDRLAGGLRFVRQPERADG